MYFLYLPSSIYLSKSLFLYFFLISLLKLNMFLCFLPLFLCSSVHIFVCLSIFSIVLFRCLYLLCYLPVHYSRATVLLTPVYMCLQPISCRWLGTHSSPSLTLLSTTSPLGYITPPALPPLPRIHSSSTALHMPSFKLYKIRESNPVILHMQLLRYTTTILQ